MSEQIMIDLIPGIFQTVSPRKALKYIDKLKLPIDIINAFVFHNINSQAYYGVI